MSGRAGQLVVRVSMTTVSPLGSRDVSSVTGMLPFPWAAVSPGRVALKPSASASRL